MLEELYTVFILVGFFVFRAIMASSLEKKVEQERLEQIEREKDERRCKEEEARMLLEHKRRDEEERQRFIEEARLQIERERLEKQEVDRKTRQR